MTCPDQICGFLKGDDDQICGSLKGDDDQICGSLKVHDNQICGSLKGHDNQICGRLSPRVGFGPYFRLLFRTTGLTDSLGSLK